MATLSLGNVRALVVGMVAGAATLAAVSGADARVTRIIIDAKASLSGQDIPYETITGRAFGELDPNDPHDALITDIDLRMARSSTSPASSS